MSRVDLPEPAFAEQGQAFAGVNFQVDPVQGENRHDAGVDLADPFQADLGRILVCFCWHMKRGKSLRRLVPVEA